ncbi:MAG: hypothetical protein KF712_01300 [Akkermansiaceae bacterium]|nr:hypothetical protein [Akkermansiaceae bacterium]
MKARTKNSLTFSDTLFVSGLSAVGILIPCLVVRLHFFQSAAVDLSPLRWLIALPATLLALLFVGFNLHTTFLRPWLYRRSHGDHNGYRHVSGAPGGGSLMIAIAALFLPNAPLIGGALLALYLLDPGGIHIAACMMLRECLTDMRKRSFQDG